MCLKAVQNILATYLNKVGSHQLENQLSLIILVKEREAKVWMMSTVKGYQAKNQLKQFVLKVKIDKIKIGFGFIFGDGCSSIH